MNSRDKRIIGFLFTLLVLVVGGTVYAAVPHDTLRTRGGVSTLVADYLNATLGLSIGPYRVIDANLDADLNSVNFTGPTPIAFNGTNIEPDVLLDPQQPASYIIWKSGSTYYAKNGTTGAIEQSGADFYTILEAVEDPMASGGEIHLKEGIFDLSNRFIISNDNITLSGEGANTVLNFTYSGTPILPMIQATGRTGIIIKDLALDGNKNKLPGAWWVNAEGIDFRNVNETILTNLWIYDIQADGIDLDNCSYILINKVFGEKNGQRLIHVSGYNKYISVSDCIDIESGIEYDPADSSCSFDVYATTNYHISFINCKSIGAKRGFSIRAGTNINILSCYAIKATNEGLLNTGTLSGLKIQGSHFIQNVRGIRIQGIVSFSDFIGNLFDSNTGQAFDIDGNITNCDISHNQFMGAVSSNYIRIHGKGSILNSIAFNKFYDIPNTQSGIMNMGSNQTIAGNIFYGVAGAYGYRGFNPATDNFIYGNDFRHVGLVLPRDTDITRNNEGYDELGDLQIAGNNLQMYNGTAWVTIGSW